MSALSDPHALANIPLFYGLSQAQLEATSERLHRQHFPAGSNVITVETVGEVVYVILSGTVKIKVDQPDGSEVIIAILGAGDIVGELSMLDSVPRSADVRTQEDSILLWMDRATFHEILAEIPEIAHNLLRILARRLRLSTEQIQALCTLDVYGKVARQLLIFADLHGVETPQGIDIPMRLTQSDIAGLVGASRERVNQVFVNLRNRNLVTVNGSHRITILDVRKLREIVENR